LPEAFRIFDSSAWAGGVGHKEMARPKWLFNYKTDSIFYGFSGVVFPAQKLDPPPRQDVCKAHRNAPLNP
jgi:hypothetical protein